MCRVGTATACEVYWFHLPRALLQIMYSMSRRQNLSPALLLKGASAEQRKKILEYSFRKSLDIFFTAHLNFLMLTELEKKIIASIQEDLAVTERPFLEISKSVKVPEEVILDTLKALCTKGVIRRFGATIRHQKSGFEANAMAAWRVDEARIDSIGELMASFKEVSHCYRRNPTDGWPYNLYTMIHASDEESCKTTARKMARKASVDNYALLFSRRELKKTSMKYFPDI